MTRAAINAAITRDQLLYSSHDTNDLIHSDGFMVYNNGSRITVTDAWVAVEESAPNPPVIPDTALSIPDPNLVENTVTNDLPVTIYVTFATLRPADADVPEEGYRTSGYYPILPGDSRTFHAAANEPVFFRFQRFDGGYGRKEFHGDAMYLSPAADTPTVSSWMPFEVTYDDDEPIFLEDGTLLAPSSPVSFESLTYKSFNIVTPTNLMFGAATLEQIAFTDIPHRATLSDDGFTQQVIKLIKDDGFIKYRNGSHITVNGEWSVRWGAMAQTTVAVFNTAFGVFSAGDPVSILGDPVRADAYDPPYIDEDLDIEITFTNDLPVTIYITFAGWFSEDGYRIVGYIPILPGDSYTTPISAFSEDSYANSFFRVQRLDKHSRFVNTFNYLSPDEDTPTVSLWAPQEIGQVDTPGHSSGVDFESLTFKSFNIVTNSWWAEVFGGDEPKIISSDVPKKYLQESDGFIEYWSINTVTDETFTVTDEWVFRDRFGEPLEDMYARLRGVGTDGSISFPSVRADHGWNVFFEDANLRRAINSQLGKAENDPISDGEMVTLENLSLESSNIHYLGGLHRASQLRILNLSNNNISYVSLLKNLVNLEVLSLDSNKISDVSPLKDLVKLEVLSLERNLISDVSPLKDLIKLKILKLLGNPLHSADQLSHLTAKIEIDPALADGGLSDLPISIPDPILRSAIAAKLGKAENDPISEKDMWTLIELIASDRFQFKAPEDSRPDRS